jgi:hypothetical protein
MQNYRADESRLTWPRQSGRAERGIRSLEVAVGIAHPNAERTSRKLARARIAGNRSLPAPAPYHPGFWRQEPSPGCSNSSEPDKDEPGGEYEGHDRCRPDSPRWFPSAAPESSTDCHDDGHEDGEPQEPPSRRQQGGNAEGDTDAGAPRQDHPCMGACLLEAGSYLGIAWL